MTDQWSCPHCKEKDAEIARLRAALTEIHERAKEANKPIYKWWLDVEDVKAFDFYEHKAAEGLGLKDDEVTK